MNQSSHSENQEAPENHQSKKLDMIEAAAEGAGETKNRRMPTAVRLEGEETCTFARASRTA